ncbi:MAG: hypothetical protein O7J95_03690, partial [Planctomycetota bacterium]|nr:hypothetical protein [Planctomycetota bacterium]
MRLLFHLPILCLLLVGFTACARENNNGPDGPEDPPPGERPVAPVAPVASATIRGQVTLVGEAPTMRFVRIGEPTCVKYHQTTGQKPRNEQVVAGPRGELANCFVYVSKGVKKVPRPSQTPVDLDQKGCIYTPHVVGVQVGQPLHVKNNDPLMHNVNALAKKNRPSNQAQPKGSKPIVKTFRQPEIMMMVICNVHSWMRAWVG